MAWHDGTGRQAAKTGKKRLGNNKAIANTGVVTAWTGQPKL